MGRLETVGMARVSLPYLSEANQSVGLASCLWAWGEGGGQKFWKTTI